MSKADRELSGSFAANRGKLPMPISGAYIITSHYGQYAVEGLRNVKLDNKGIDIQGKPGAQARAIFDGKVAGCIPVERVIQCAYPSRQLHFCLLQPFFGLGQDW